MYNETVILSENFGEAKPCDEPACRRRFTNLGKIVKSPTRFGPKADYNNNNETLFRTDKSKPFVCCSVVCENVKIMLVFLKLL